jgi:hypothetical protein
MTKRNKKSAIAATDLMSLKEGELDPISNVTIASLISRTPTCIVYLDSDNALHLHVTDDHEFPKDRSVIAEVEACVRELRLSARVRLEPNQQTAFCYLLAHAVALAYTPNEASAANQAIQEARRFLTANGNSRDRQWILATALSTASAATLFSYLTWAWRADLVAAYGGAALLVALSTFIGALGASVSVILRTAKLPVAPGTGPMAYATECIARAVVGAVSGALVSLCVQGNLLLGFINGETSAPARTATMLVLALAAGISERILPSIVGQVEQQVHVGAEDL